ncbi:amino acid adenylation domain-containing protein, partial [Mycobacterium sp. KBS0706]|uniref:AMP-binding protein n=1 Tax=Mycobacterium sp. KBS0706 TaxID=2578109 RepID=UPI00117CD980
RPKGVVGLHAGLVNRLAWRAALHPYVPGGPACAKSSLSFIDGTTELLGPLLHGGRQVLIDPASARDAAALSARIAEHGIEHVTVVPGLLDAMLGEAAAAGRDFGGLWISSGERLPERLVERFAGTWPKARLVNFYGASEASGDSLFAECRGGDAPIGRPIWNTRVYVLDSGLRPVPVGVSGELYVAGAG